MEKLIIAAAIVAVAYLVYRIAKASQSKGGHGAGGKPGRSDEL